MNNYLSQIIAGSIGGLIVVLIINFYNIIVRPRLDISFDYLDTFDEVPIGKIDGVASSEFLSKQGLYVHLNIKNKRRALARGCKVFLIKIEKYNEQKSKFEEIRLKKHYHFKWANEPEEKEGYEGLEIPGKYRRRVDFVHSTKGEYQAGFFVKVGWLGIGNMINEGIYRMTIQASGENTNTVTKRFIFIWKGKFLRENIQVIKETSTYRLKRFIKRI